MTPLIGLRYDFSLTGCDYTRNNGAVVRAGIRFGKNESERIGEEPSTNKETNNRIRSAVVVGGGGNFEMAVKESCQGMARQEVAETKERIRYMVVPGGEGNFDMVVKETVHE